MPLEQNQAKKLMDCCKQLSDKFEFNKKAIKQVVSQSTNAFSNLTKTFFVGKDLVTQCQNSVVGTDGAFDNVKTIYDEFSDVFTKHEEELYVKIEKLHQELMDTYADLNHKHFKDLDDDMEIRVNGHTLPLNTLLDCYCEYCKGNAQYSYLSKLSEADLLALV